MHWMDVEHPSEWNVLLISWCVELMFNIRVDIGLCVRVFVMTVKESDTNALLALTQFNHN